jgi:hypothetical protein
LREHAVPGALAWRGILRGQQNRATPFPAQAQPLAEAAEGQQQRGDDADLRIGGQQTNGQGGQPHGQQRRYQGRLAADTVTEMTEQGRAQGTGEKGECKGGE